MRETIDFGIHLGMTHRAVALRQGTAVQVIKNNQEADRTPSVVWLDKKGDLRVGRLSKNSIEADPESGARLTLQSTPDRLVAQGAAVFAGTQRLERPARFGQRMIVAPLHGGAQ